MAQVGYPAVPRPPSPPAVALGPRSPGLADLQDYVRDLADWAQKARQTVNGVLNGRINAAGTVTLTANSATTTLSDPRIGANSRIFLFPTSTTAATEFGAGTLQISAKTNESATITHVNNAETDRTFDYLVIAA